MTYLPFSNRFEKIFSDSKELTSSWKTYEIEIRKVAGVISEYDRQIEAIKRACKDDGEIHGYCPGETFGKLKPLRNRYVICTCVIS